MENSGWPQIMTFETTAANETTSAMNDREDDEDDQRRSTSIYFYQIVLATSMALIMLSSVVGNVFTLIAVYRVRALHTMTSVFVVNLAVADALAGLTCMPFTLVSSLADRWLFGDAFCHIDGFLNGTFCVTSISTLSAVAVERYYAIVHPFRYHETMTRTTASLMVAYTWGYSIFAALLPLFGWSHYVYLDTEYLCTVAWNYDAVYTTFVTATCFGVQITTLVYTYFHIFKVAIRQQRAVHAHSKSRRPAAVNGNCSTATSSSSESKAAFVLFIVIGTFVVCWAPHGFGMLCLGFYEDRCPIPDWFFAVSTWLAMLNSACNPVIYGIMNRQFRQAYADILRCSCWRKKIGQ